MFNFGAEKNEYPRNLRKFALKLHIWIQLVGVLMTLHVHDVTE